MNSPTVGILGDETAEAAVRAAGGQPVVGRTAVAAADPTYVVAIGESALLAAIETVGEVPVLPVEAGVGVRSVSCESLVTAVESLIKGAHDTVALPVIAAQSPVGEARALAEVMLVAAEPARISEYTVTSDGDRVATFRADGVVVATPAGSRGYARRADGPLVAPEVDALAVVPVAPFSTSEDAWVVPPTGLELRVERDETPVELLADDRTAGTVGLGESVQVDRDGTLSIALVDGSTGRFG
ncbi:ATP-NAD kinase [Halosegnis sp.]|uniref:ATP-NAD kinase n=1 Tax=Halosegnis sp. TaxID=2864959 RepID=UPI0035D3E75C